jgi:hypothetical protein
MFVIATKPGRKVKAWYRVHQNGTQKFAVVKANGKFQWVTDINKATLFRSATDLLFAIGVRARNLSGRFGGLTKDVTWAEVEQVGVKVKAIANGG